MAVIPANNNTGLYNTSGTPATTGNDITVSGNVNANNFNATSQVNAGTNITAAGNISAGGYFIGNGSLLTGIANDYGNATVAAYLASGTNTSNVITTGNVSGTYVLGNGSQLTGLPATYSNANVVTLLASFGSNTVSTTGNITGSYILGNGSQLTGLPESYGNANVAVYLPTYTGNLAGGNAAITNDLTVGGTIYGTFSGNISGNLVVPGANTEVIYNNSGNAGASSDFTFNESTKVLTVTGNATATQFNGSGVGLTNLPGANVTGTVANATYATSAGTATSATTAGTVTTAAQPNITSVGTLSSLSTSGNIDVGGSLNTDDVTSTGNVTIYGNQVITGNLTVQGTTTTINSNTITTNDKTITVANNQSTGANVDGAGLEAGNPAVATWLYNDATTTWKSSIGISAVGNITGSYILGNGSQLTGLPATYGNSDVTTLLAAFGSNTIVTTGNITAGNINVTNIGSTTGAAGKIIFPSNGELQLRAIDNNVSIQTSTIFITGNTTQTGSIGASGNVTAGGVLTDGYYYANGTPVSFSGTYGNSNVNTHLAAFGANTISTTGNITAGYFLGNGSQLTGIATGNYSNANVADYLPTYSGNIASVGSPLSQLFATNIQATSISSPGDTVAIEGITSTGTISATGNISTGSYFIGNGSQLTGLVQTLGGNMTANINTDSYYIQNPGGQVNMGNVRIYGSLGLAVDTISSPSGDFVTIEGVSATNGVQTTANITAGYYIGNGSLLTGISTGLAGNLTGNIDTGSYYIQNSGGQVNMGNVRIHGSLGLATDTISSPSGDFVTIEGVSATNGVQTTANISAGYFLGNGSQLTGINTSLAGNLTGNINTDGYYIQNPGSEVLMGNVWVTGTFAANSISSPGGDYVSIEGITVTNGMISSGNVQGANLIANTSVFTGTLSATNLVANTQIGNLLFLNQQIQTTQASAPSTSASIVPNPGRITIGNGYNGNISPAYDVNNNGRGARLMVSDSVGLTDANTIIRGAVVQNYYTLNANIAGSGARVAGFSTYTAMGGGSAANTISGGASAVTGLQSGLQIGGGTSGNLTGLGNTVVQYSSGVLAIVAPQIGSTGGNVFGTLSLINNAGTANTAVGSSPWMIGSGTYGNVYSFYNPSSTNTYGPTIANTARNATNYYAFYNDDNVAQMKLGSLRFFHEYQYALSSSAGALTIDKNNGQVQFLSVSEAITSVTLSNFVVSASTGSTTKYQTDTVTLIVKQDGTGRSITLPSGSNYKYAGGITTIPTTASSVSMVSITAYYDAGAAATVYLFTISPEFT